MIKTKKLFSGPTPYEFKSKTEQTKTHCQTYLFAEFITMIKTYHVKSHYSFVSSQGGPSSKYNSFQL